MGELTNKTNNLPSTEVQQESSVLASDIIVPYVGLAQASSEAVKSRAVQMGDIYRTTNLESLGGPDKLVDVIFLDAPQNNWILEQKEGNRFQYRGIEKRNASNENLPWTFWADKDGNEMAEGQPGATEWRRVKQMRVFAILPKDIEASKEEIKKIELGELPDPNKALTPVVFTFRSSSYKAGKEIATFFSQAQSMKAPIHRYILGATCTLEKNDEGSFYVWKIQRNPTKAVTKEDLPLVEEWVKILRTSKDKIQTHEEGVAAEYGSTQAEPIDVTASKDVC